MNRPYKKLTLWFVKKWVSLRLVLFVFFACFSFAPLARGKSQLTHKKMDPQLRVHDLDRSDRIIRSI